MKKQIFFGLLALSLTSPLAYGADEICVVGAGIEYNAEFETYTYIVGVGNDTTPKPITPLNERVAEVLSKAARELKKDVMICMQGSTLRLSSTRYQYMVFKAEQRAIKPIR